MRGKAAAGAIVETVEETVACAALGVAWERCGRGGVINIGGRVVGLDSYQRSGGAESQRRSERYNRITI